MIQGFVLVNTVKLAANGKHCKRKKTGRIVTDQDDETSFSKTVLKSRFLIEVAPFPHEDVSFWGRSCKILFVQPLCFCQVPYLLCPLPIHAGFTRLQHRNEFSLQEKDNEIVLVDAESGFEHFGRQVDKSCDLMICIAKPNYKLNQITHLKIRNQVF